MSASRWVVALSVAAGAVVGALPAAVPASAQGVSATPTALATPSVLPDAAAGLAIYGERCVRCHGPRGGGDGDMLVELPMRRPGQPPSFADPSYVRGVTPATAFDVVTQGRIDLGMPPWAEALTEPERWHAVYGAWAFYYTPERLIRGRTAWAAACAECHGPDGRLLATVPLADAGYMATRSQADLFAATRQAPSGHADLVALPDDELWSALDFARTFTYRPPALGDLALGGRIAGRLVHGSAGATGPLSATVRLVPIDVLGTSAPLTVTAATDGSFAFDDLVAGPGARYALMSRHQGVEAWASAAITLTRAVSAAVDVRLPVYEPATDVPLSMRTGHIVVAPDAEAGLLRVAEVWVIRNDTDRVLVAPGGGATVRFPLPADLSEIRIEDERMRAADRMEGDVLVDTLPVPPGERQVVISYDLPYTGTTARIERVLPLDTAEMRVLATGPGVRLDSAPLPERETTNVRGEAVQQVIGRNLTAGAAMPIQLAGLPPSSGAAAAASAAAPAGGIEQRWLTWLGVLLGLLGVVVALLYPRLAGGVGSAVLADRLAADRRELVRQIAALDGARAAGQVAEAEYAERRAALMDRALAVARQQMSLQESNA